MTTLVLRIADLDGDFVVCIDAIKEGLCGILMQNDYAICYESRKFKKHEQRHPTHNIDLVSIIHASKIWRHKLMGKRFLLNTYDISLNYLFDQWYWNSKKDKWLAFLSEYHFELKHIKGKENKIVYALSRRAHMLHEITLSQTNSYFHDRIRTKRRVDHFYVEVLKKYSGG